MKNRFKQQYFKRSSVSLDDYTFWGVRMEILFRGFTKAEMFSIDQEFRQIIAKKKQDAATGGRLREVVVEKMQTDAFKDILQ
jgi:hypothetical protein